MLVAINQCNERIYSTEAKKEENYYCPICNNKVIFKNGKINIPHFAHKENICTDNWNYDMSEWHKKMQSYFDKEYQEIIICKNGIKHRADILKDNIVIEFQHSKISAEEFKNRNDFYTSAGYRVAWVFDVTEQVENEQLYWNENSENDNILKWKHPMKILQSAPIPKKENDIIICLTWNFNNSLQNEIYKIEWSSKTDGYPDYKNIAVKLPSLVMQKNISFKNLFYYSNHRTILNTLTKLGVKYNIKKIGGRNFPRDSYICPINKQIFGIKLYGNNGCTSCKYFATYEKCDIKQYNVYCCYPNKVNNKTNMHP